MLLPIDMYGINVLGVTLKPYMIFSMILMCRLFRKNNGKLYIGNDRIRLGTILCCLALGINLINNNQISSLVTISMVPVVLICVLIYLSNISDTYNDIAEIITATAIGYGIVYIFGYAMLYGGANLPGIIATSRMESGIFMQFNNMYNGSFLQTYRLRGFAIDPNVVIGTFAPAVAVALPKVLLRNGNWRDYLSVVISAACIFLTSSRMALLILAGIVFLSLLIMFREIPKSKQGLYFLVTFFSVIIILAIAFFSDIKDQLFSNLFGAYTNRSGLTDEYGRFTLWKESWDILLSHNIFLGVGCGQLQYLSSHGLAAHNTWLEWVCSCGILVGTGIVIYFFCISIWLWKQSRTIHVTDHLFSVSQGVTLGFLSIVIALISVDNITNSYLWFLCYTGQALFDNYHRKLA